MSRARVAVLTCALLGSCGLFSGPPEEIEPSFSQVLNHRGLERLAAGDLETARRDFEEALEHAERLDDLVGQAESWNNLATLERIRGELTSTEVGDVVRESHERALLLHREARNAEGEARTLRNLGTLALARGLEARSLEHFDQAFLVAEASSDRVGEDLARIGKAAAWIALGREAEALLLLEGVEERARDAEDSERLAAALVNRGAALEALGRWGEAREPFAEALELDRTRGAPRHVALDLEALGRIAAALEDGAAVLGYALREARVLLRLGDVEGARRALERGRPHLAEDDPAKAREWSRLEERCSREGEEGTP